MISKTDNSMTGETKLVAAIIKDAVQDLDSPNERRRMDAERFLSGSDEMLQLWLSLAGMDIDSSAILRLAGKDRK